MVLEPLSALAVAAGVIDFVEFSYNILSETRKTYQSVLGTNAEKEELEIVSENIRRLVAP